MFKLTTNDIEGQTSEITESLDELARKGARRMIAAALELEAEQYVQALRHLRDDQGHALVVHNGTSHHERTVQLGAGSIIFALLVYSFSEAVPPTRRCASVIPFGGNR